MSHYYVNKNAQSSGEHEVHTGSCSFLPETNNLIYLGSFSTCSHAITEAKKHFSNVDGCYFCSNSCHSK